MTLFENDVYRLTLTGAGRRIDLGRFDVVSTLGAGNVFQGVSAIPAWDELERSVRGRVVA